jgi:O-methyltransferase
MDTIDRASQQELLDMYLSLVKATLKNLPYLENEWNPIQPRGRARRIALRATRYLGVQLCHARQSTLSERLRATDHTSIAHTMVSMQRLDHLQSCVNDVLLEGIPGDFIETGVLRGGCSILMRAILKAYGVTDRLVWLADSFEGLPAPNPDKYPADTGAEWHLFLGGDAGLESVKRNFNRYGLLDDQVRFLKGWFRDTLPHAEIGDLALLRLDGDLYESTMDALVPLYPRVSPGGYILVDDYDLPMCRKAVNDFRDINDISDPITFVEGSGAGAYWRRMM